MALGLKRLVLNENVAPEGGEQPAPTHASPIVCLQCTIAR